MLGQKVLPIRCVSNRRARRYILRLKPDGTAQVTVPRGGSKAFALDFARRHSTWLEAQLHKQQSLPVQRPQPWTNDTEILFRGEKVRLALDREASLVRFADQVIRLRQGEVDLRPPVQSHLWGLATRELSTRALELAALHKALLRRIMVRNQRSRWGSCSAKRTLSLNWRLIQAPPPVRDYIILHELMHLQQMNHSRKFWQLIAEVCPDYEAAETWLDQHDYLLRA